MIVEISPEETKSLLDSGASFRLIDCREQDEWNLVHIEGAELIPLSVFSGEAPARLTAKDEPIIVYCHAGVRSARASAYLIQLGYSNVRSMRGGIEAWSMQVDSSVPRY
jgi:rhodanese-related sulfurtransferase